MMLRVLFPSDPLNPSKIDPEFESEYAAVRMLGGKTSLFDFDLFKKGDVSEAFKRTQFQASPEMWIYRGWMMTPEQYEEFHKTVRALNYQLINSPAVYSICHVYPLVYSYIKQKAVPTYYTEGTDIDHDGLVNFFGGSSVKDRRLFVKDWVKSAKGTPGATFVGDYNNLDDILDVVSKLKKERGDLFYHGLVFKKFVDIIKRPDGKDEEYRAFFYKDRLVTWHPANGVGGRQFPPPEWIESVSKNVPGDFYTLDFVFVQGESGPEALILEAGDGGVSGLSVGQPPISFYSMLESSIAVNLEA